MTETNGLKGEGDRFLIEAIRSGDEGAFRQLVDRFSGRLAAYAARRLSGTGLDAEDAVQETFLGLLRSLERLERVRSLEAYLFQILRNKMVDLTARRPQAHGLRRVPLAGDKIRAVVTELSPSRQKLSLSVRELARQEQRQEMQKYIGAEEDDSTFTLGDILKDKENG